MSPQEKLFRASVEQYITVKLNTPHKGLGNLPICPYASAYAAKTVTLFPKASFSTELKRWYKLWDPHSHTVVVLAWRLPISAAQSELYCDKLQAALWDKDCTVLLDHPHNPHPVANVHTGFDEGVLVILQRTSVLLRSRTHLKLNHPEYYANWSKRDLEQLSDE